VIKVRPHGDAASRDLLIKGIQDSMQPQRNRKKSDKSQLTLTAVAFQDHICQQMGYPISHPRSSLTLAQKLGVVPGPTPPLTSVQWEKAKEISRVRGDSAHPCPICQDEFRLQDQASYSCHGDRCYGNQTVATVAVVTCHRLIWVVLTGTAILYSHFP
jgi:hypothetical protein